MPVNCSVCADSRRLEIDDQLLRGQALRVVGARFGINKSSIHRHFSRHVSGEAPPGVEVVSATERLASIEKEARRLGKLAEREGDFRGALAAVRELVRLVELSAKLSGALQGDRVAVNINLDEETATRMAQVFLARRLPPAPAVEILTTAERAES